MEAGSGHNVSNAPTIMLGAAAANSITNLILGLAKLLLNILGGAGSKRSEGRAIEIVVSRVSWNVGASQ